MGRYADSVSRILLEQGRANAQGQLGSGQAWGHFAEQLGQIPAQLADQRAQQQELQQKQAAQAQDRDLRQQQIQQGQQRLDQEQAGIDEGKRKAFSAQQIHDAAEQAYGQIQGGNAEAVLSLLPPESRVMAEGWLGNVAKAKEDRDAQGVALGKQTAQFIQANGYDPVTSATALRVLSDVHPGAKDALEHVSDPVAFRKLIDHFATLGDKPGAPFKLGPGETQFTPQGQPIATGQPKPVEPITPYQQASLTETARAHRATEAGAAAGRAQAARDPRKELTPNAEANITRQYVKQWTEAGKPARDLDRQVALIDAGMTAAERGDVAQGAQTVLVAFQKILDPTSVVREAEFDRSAAAQSMYQRVRGAAERLAVGGAGVPVAELRKFHTLAKEAAAAQKSAYLSAVKERIGRNADRYNIPRELVFEALPEEAVSDVPRDTPVATAGTGPAGSGVTVKTPDGQTFSFPNQAQADVFKKRAGL